jgi:hypothetical protein
VLHTENCPSGQQVLPLPPGHPAATKVAAKARIIKVKRILYGRYRWPEVIVVQVIE